MYAQKKALRTSNTDLEDGERKPSGPQQHWAMAAMHDCSYRIIKSNKQEGLLEGPVLWFLYLTHHLLSMSVGYKQPLLLDRDVAVLLVATPSSLAAWSESSAVSQQG